MSAIVSDDPMSEARRSTSAEAAILESIGKQVAAGRHDVAATQRHLARVVGVSQSTISRLEHGQRAVSIFTLYRIAAALGGLRLGADDAVGRGRLRSWF